MTAVQQNGFILPLLMVVRPTLQPDLALIDSSQAVLHFNLNYDYSTSEGCKIPLPRLDLGVDFKAGRVRFSELFLQF